LERQLLTPGEQLAGRASILALEPGVELAARLDAFERSRILLEPRRVGGERARGLGRRDPGLAQGGNLRRERGIEGRGLLERARRGGERLRRRAFALREPLERLRRERAQAIGVRQPRVLARQLLLLA